MPQAFYPLSLEDVEDIEDYKPGGFHPVYLQEIYQKRYKILHKLGAGGYSTTWLARDEVEHRYVALKIEQASEFAICPEHRMLQSLGDDVQSGHPGRRHVRRLLDQFVVSGPNGEHRCLVMEVAGPTLLQLYDDPPSRCARRLQASVARRIARQVVEALAYLHSKEIGHGGTSAVFASGGTPN